MLLNYIKLALRLLVRNPFLTIINIVGLSVGFASFYILWPYATSELGSDQFHKDHESIARLTWHHRWTDNKQDWDEFYNASNFCGIGKRIADEFSEVKDLTRLVPQEFFSKECQGVTSNVFFTVNQNDSRKEIFEEKNTAFADPNFFKFFSFPLIAGDAANVLLEPGSVVISRKHSHKYFGSADPINSIIYLNDSIPLRVTGVCKDLPKNTHFRFDIIVTTAGKNDIDLPFSSDNLPDWMGANYIKINEGVKFEDIQQKVDDQRKELYDHWESADPTISVEPLKDVAFSDTAENVFAYKSKNALLLLRAMAFIILFLAWTNYLSFSISTLHKRMPEVGTRKVVGARNRDFITQFLVESAIMNFSSLLLALTFVQLLRSPVEVLFHFYIPEWQGVLNQHFVIMLIMPAVGILATGAYPVLISSKKGAADLLKKLRPVQMPWWIRSMVTVQYAAAVVLLIWIGAVYFQLDYILNKNIGINAAGLLAVDFPSRQKGNYSNKLDYFIDSSLKISGIHGASRSRSVMGDNTGVPIMVKRSANAVSVGLFSNGAVDENFLDLYGIPLLAGRSFIQDLPSDQKSVMLSRTAVRRLGFSAPEECIGSKIVLPAYNVADAEIVGVYGDYDLQPYFALAVISNGSMLTYKNSLTPDRVASKISFKMNLENAATIIARLEELYKTTFPQETFTWTFLDQNISRHYAQEQIARNQIMLFTLMAIGIACLGLLGTATNKSIEKTKEIGIRKILGARMHQIAQIILNTTARQVVIANVIGLPAAYYLVGKHLERYSERLSFQWWHYALPVAILLVIMSLTIVGVLLKAAKTNPVESLRSE